jgi:hypothetical protein
MTITSSADSGLIPTATTTNAAPDTQASVFFQGTPPLGLTMVLSVLQRGSVLVCSVTTTDGTSDTVTAGPLLFIDQHGTLIKTFATSLDGPWGLALSDDFDHAKVFVSNVLNGTVTRICVSLPDSETVNITGTTQIASGYKHRRDPATHPSEIVEFTKTGHFIGEYNIHQNQGGAFGVHWRRGKDIQTTRSIVWRW